MVRQFSRHRGIGTLLIHRDMHENKQATIAAWVATRVPAPIGKPIVATRSHGEEA